MPNMIEIIANDLQLDENYLENLIGNCDKFYRTYFKRKADGTSRRISHPSPELKTLQYWCVKNIFSKCPLSEAAYAYRKGVSIKRNAEAHSQNHFFLHMDIENFFESITNRHLNKFMTDNIALFPEYNSDSTDFIDTVSKICLRNNYMCIGAVSSPAISNAIMYEFDKKALSYAKNKGFIYTRYSDDMYISSPNYIDADILDYFEGCLREYDFRLNRNKTRFMSVKGRRKVTGLIITNSKKVSVGLKMRNQIKEMVYKKVAKGEGDSTTIMGYLSFLKDIEPLAFNRIIIKYSKYGNVLDLIKK